MNELVAYRITRADDCLKEAQLLADAGHYNACINRLYYACFYAVNAALLARGLSSTKHSGVRSLFNRHFVKTGMVTKETAAAYNDLFESRQESDYEDFFLVEKDAAVGYMKLAHEFVVSIKKLL